MTSDSQVLEADRFSLDQDLSEILPKLLAEEKDFEETARKDTTPTFVQEAEIKDPSPTLVQEAEIKNPSPTFVHKAFLPFYEKSKQLETLSWNEFLKFHQELSQYIESGNPMVSDSVEPTKCTVDPINLTLTEKKNFLLFRQGKLLLPSVDLTSKAAEKNQKLNVKTLELYRKAFGLLYGVELTSENAESIYDQVKAKDDFANLANVISVAKKVIKTRNAQESSIPSKFRRLQPSEYQRIVLLEEVRVALFQSFNKRMEQFNFEKGEILDCHNRLMALTKEKDNVPKVSSSPVTNPFVKIEQT